MQSGGDWKRQNNAVIDTPEMRKCLYVKLLALPFVLNVPGIVPRGHPALPGRTDILQKLGFSQVQQTETYQYLPIMFAAEVLPLSMADVWLNPIDPSAMAFFHPVATKDRSG